jgi:hypothetical protein
MAASSTQLTPKKLKLSHYTPWRRLGERRYNSYSFSTSAVDGGEWSASRPGRALVSGKGPPVPTVQEAGWAPEPVWTQRLKEKSFRLCRELNLDRPVSQPVARKYDDWAPGSHHYHQRVSFFSQLSWKRKSEDCKINFLSVHPSVCVPPLIFFKHLVGFL